MAGPDQPYGGGFSAPPYSNYIAGQISAMVNNHDQLQQQYAANVAETPQISSVQVTPTGVSQTNQAINAMSTNPESVSKVNSTQMLNPNISQQQSNKDFGVASFCRLGLETVQEIVSRTQEVFLTLKNINPPRGTRPDGQMCTEKRKKVQEQLRTIRLLFKRLKIIYAKCNENSQITEMDFKSVESFIPLKEDFEYKPDEDISEACPEVYEENQELRKQVAQKNKQIKQIIDQLRTIIFQINNMIYRVDANQ